jgi:hypothetical protein
MEVSNKKTISDNIARDRATKILARYVEELVVPSKAFANLRDVLTSGSERNTKQFFERMSMQLFHILFTTYEYISDEERTSIHEILCSMYPVDMEKVLRLLEGQQILAEVTEAEETKGEVVMSEPVLVNEVSDNIAIVTPMPHVERIYEKEPVAIKSKWSKNVHLRERGELVTICGVTLENKDLRKRLTGLKMCSKCQRHVHKEEKVPEKES